MKETIRNYHKGKYTITKLDLFAKYSQSLAIKKELKTCHECKASRNNPINLITYVHEQPIITIYEY